MSKLSRQEVYAMIDTERDYQDVRWENSLSKGIHSPEEWFMYIEHYVGQAKQILSSEEVQTAYPKAMEIMRKVAAMTVKAMEDLGTVKRK
jgi:hypothetical protein